MAEIAGYIGGAFVVGAAILFFANTWSELSLAGQIGLLAVATVVLLVAGVAVVASAGGPAALRDPAEAVRRRLASVLLTGAAGTAGFGAGLGLVDRLDNNEELAVMLAATVALVVALGGYLVASTTVGQLGIAATWCVIVPTGLGSLHTDSESVLAVSALFVVVGVAWLLAAERGLWREVLSARVIGLAFTLVGAQIAVADERAWVGYLLTLLVGVAAFGLYLRTRSWPYLAAGVIAVTVAVPEAVSDFTDGSVGAAGILLATGVTLLGASLLGLRLRQEVKEQTT